jgi:hypothetical protein
MRNFSPSTCQHILPPFWRIVAYHPAQNKLNFSVAGGKVYILVLLYDGAFGDGDDRLGERGFVGSHALTFEIFSIHKGHSFVDLAE